MRSLFDWDERWPDEHDDELDDFADEDDELDRSVVRAELSWNTVVDETHDPGCAALDDNDHVGDMIAWVAPIR